MTIINRLGNFLLICGSLYRFQFHRMAWVEKDFKDHRVSTPLPQAGSPTRLPRATSSLTLNTSRDEASTTSLGNLIQCVTTHRVKNLPPNVGWINKIQDDMYFCPGHKLQDNVRILQYSSQYKSGIKLNNT